MNFRRSLLIFILLIVFSGLRAGAVQAATMTSGDLQVTADSPLFPSGAVWAPGISMTRSFSVKNLGNTGHTLSVQAINTSQSENIADKFFVKFLSNGVVQYGDNPAKTMKQFWDDGQINLYNLNGAETANFDMEVRMAPEPGNELQGKSASFDLVIGFAGTSSQVVLSATSSNQSSGGYSGEILGSEDNLGSGSATLAGSPALQPEILGYADNKTDSNWWLWLLILLFLALLIFIWLHRRQKRSYNG
ncbi:hypothetical protein M1403_01520 [Patescibacteria group bacterium]|nr:hypothetical protein [Patescibacteria group bacterium]